MVVNACKTVTENNEFVENVRTANSALFIYVSTHCVKQVKKHDYKLLSQLTRWCSGNASALGSNGPGFTSRLPRVFLCLMLCFVVVFLLFGHKIFAISFSMLMYLA